MTTPSLLRRLAGPLTALALLAALLPSAASAAGVITQVNTTAQVVATTALTTQINTTGQNGAVTFTTTTGPAFTVGQSGIVAVPATLIPGTYTVSGTDQDSSGDTGTWSFTVTVTPANGTITLVYNAATATAGAPYSYTLVTSGATGPVTFLTTSSGAFSVSSSGVLSAPASLTPGTYTASGTTSDLYGDQGTWSFTLTLTSPSLTISTINSSGQTTAGTPFSATITISTPYPATFVTTTPGSFSVSSSGGVSAPSTLTPGTYTASGTVSDAYGDSGVWTYTLTVLPAGNLLTQDPSTYSATITQNSPYSGTLLMNGASSAPTYSTLYSTGQVAVSSSGAISAPSTLSPGTYSLNGTATDTNGDTGVWSFTLVVNPISSTPLPTVTFTSSPPSQPTPGSSYSPVATSPSGPVSYSINALSGVCTLSGSTVLLLSPGICTVIASISTPAGQVSAFQSFAIIGVSTTPTIAYPLGLSVTPQAYSASGTWPASASASTLANLYYTLTAQPGNHSCTTSGLTCTIVGLSPDTAYTFTVTAIYNQESATSPQTSPVMTLSASSTTSTSIPPVPHPNPSYQSALVVGFAPHSSKISPALASRLRTLSQLFLLKKLTSITVTADLVPSMSQGALVVLARSRAQQIALFLGHYLHAHHIPVTATTRWVNKHSLNQSIHVLARLG